MEFLAYCCVFFPLCSLINASILLSRQSLSQVARFSALKAIWKTGYTNKNNLESSSGSWFERKACLQNLPPSMNPREKEFLSWLRSLRHVLIRHCRSKGGQPAVYRDASWKTHQHTQLWRAGIASSPSNHRMSRSRKGIPQNLTTTRSIFCVAFSRGLWCWGGKRMTPQTWAWSELEQAHRTPLPEPQ